ncbi:MAG TPA: hypothetical protein VIS77_13185 [Burkholderiales bacterium]
MVDHRSGVLSRPLFRALAVWVLIVLAETVHGVLRQVFVVPLTGDLPARQVGVLVGSAILFAIAWACARWVGARSTAALLGIGLLWVVLIVGFEIALGMALGYTRARMLSDYDLTEGGFMGFGLLFMLFAPLLAARARGITEKGV